MPVHQCMRDIDWLLVGGFDQGLEESHSFTREGLAPYAQPSRREQGSQHPCPGESARLSWAPLLPNRCEEPCCG